MASNLLLCALLLFVGLQLASGQTNPTCKQQYDAYRVCIRGKMGQDQDDPSANYTRRQKMKNDVQTCCRNNKCQDPYPNSNEEQIRTKCFQQSNAEIRQALQQCVKSQAQYFELPGDENDKDAYWNYQMLRTYAALRSCGDNSHNRNRQNHNKWGQAYGYNQPNNDVCGNDDTAKYNTMKCLNDSGTFNKSARNSKWRRSSCQIRDQCTRVSQQCKDEWNNNYKPRICDCVNTMKKNGSLKQFQDSYIKCLKQNSFYPQDEQNDDGRAVVAKFLVSWCPSGNASQSRYVKQGGDPCKRNQNQTPPPDANQPQNQDNPLAGFFGGNDAISSITSANPLSSLLSGGSNPLSALGGGGGNPLAAFGGGGGGNPLAALGGGGGNPLAALGGGGGNPLAALGGGGGNPLSALGGGGGNLLSAFGGGSPFGTLGGGAAPDLGALGGGTDMLSSYGGGANLMGAMGGFLGSKKKK